MTTPQPPAPAAERQLAPEEIAADRILAETVAFLVAASGRVEVAAMLRSMAAHLEAPGGR
ncbi:hypothetical protein [Devosia salina]|uniref:Uncharacterized protein n=1 Tax=Devosia salina TaxID=2860336 RepID=A0ABX8WB69_9HYPH|nr:hypothetical protein [Devosia salina]QYO75334.1 hypothetical protein K1X15_11805 [Devosia salina]